VTIIKVLWPLPFFFFLAGYFSFSFIYRRQRVITPVLIGTTVQEALTLASNNHLNLRLCQEREDAELPEGTIISQNPPAHAIVKPNQTVFCVISKQPLLITPHLISKNCEVVLHELKECGIHGSCYFLESNYPKGYCFSQSPSPHTKIEKKTVTLYISSGTVHPIIFPDLKNKPIGDVIEFLRPYGITPAIARHPLQDSHDGDNSCIISDQRPLPGTLLCLDPAKPLNVQLQVAYSKKLVEAP